MKTMLFIAVPVLLLAVVTTLYHHHSSVSPFGDTMRSSMATMNSQPIVLLEEEISDSDWVDSRFITELMKKKEADAQQEQRPTPKTPFIHPNEDLKDISTDSIGSKVSAGSTSSTGIARGNGSASRNDSELSKNNRSNKESRGNKSDDHESGDNKSGEATKKETKRSYYYHTQPYDLSELTYKPEPKLVLPIGGSIRVKLIYGVSSVNYRDSAVCDVIFTHKTPEAFMHAKLQGHFYAIQKSDNIYIDFNKLILPDGKTMNIKASAGLNKNHTGIPAKVDDSIGNDLFKIIADSFVPDLSNNPTVQKGADALYQQQIQNLETRRVLSLNAGQTFNVYFKKGVYL